MSCISQCIWCKARRVQIWSFHWLHAALYPACSRWLLDGKVGKEQSKPSPRCQNQLQWHISSADPSEAFLRTFFKLCVLWKFVVQLVKLLLSKSSVVENFLHFPSRVDQLDSDHQRVVLCCPVIQGLFCHFWTLLFGYSYAWNFYFHPIWYHFEHLFIHIRMTIQLSEL